MIKIIIDSESELLWIRSVINNGLSEENLELENLNENFDIPLEQDINYIKSEDYINDMKKKYYEYNLNLYKKYNLEIADLKNWLDEHKDDLNN